MNRIHGASRPSPSLHRSRLGVRHVAATLLGGAWGSRLAMLALIGLFVWVGGLQLATPAVTPANAPATAFSAERAMAHLRVIAAEPRPVGSAAHAAARQYLIDQLTVLGLEPRTQTTSQVVREGDEGFRAGIVNNVVVRIPGTSSTGAIAINAHYDSANTGPGASDAGSGVVTALETLRAALAGAALRNDVIVVFADAEERHMMGSAAFTEQHPWAKDIRLTVNFEAQGASGPAFLYVTSRDNSWLVTEFLKVAPNPAAWSLIPTIANRFPEGRFDADLGEYTRDGGQGLGFLYTGNVTAYHTVRDNVDQIDPGSIQQEGDYTLALVRRFGDADLADMPRSGNRVFFNILPGVVVHYAAAWVVPLATLLTALVAGLVVVGVRQKELTAGGLVAGTLAGIVGPLVTVMLAALIWGAIWKLNPDYQVKSVGYYQTNLYVVALSFAAIALLTALYALLGRGVRPNNLVAGVLLGSLVALWLASLTVPGMSYLVTWPLLFAALPLAWASRARGRAAHPWARVAVLAVAAAPAIILLPATLHQIVALLVRFEGSLGIPVLGLAMLFVAPLVALLVPHLHFLGGDSPSWRVRWATPAAAALVALTLVAWGNATSGFDAEHPRPDHIAYELNADTGQARWISFDNHLDDWTTQFFAAGAKRSDHYTLTRGTIRAFAADAPRVPLAIPEVQLVSDTTDGNIRTLGLRLSSPRGTTEMTTVVNAPGAIMHATVDGRPVDLSAYKPAGNGELSLIYANVPTGGWDLTLAVRASEPIIIRIEEATDGLPAVPGLAMQSRPASTMPSPLYPRDPTIVIRTFRY